MFIQFIPKHCDVDMIRMSFFLNNRKVLRCLRKGDKLIVMPSVLPKDRTISHCLNVKVVFDPTEQAGRVCLRRLGLNEGMDGKTGEKKFA